MDGKIKKSSARVPTGRVFQIEDNWINLKSGYAER